MTDEEKLKKVAEELLAVQGAIEELSIGVIPPEWDIDWMLHSGSPKDQFKRVFKRLWEKVGGMKTFAQRTYSENHRYEHALRRIAEYESRRTRCRHVDPVDIEAVRRIARIALGEKATE